MINIFSVHACFIYSTELTEAGYMGVTVGQVELKRWLTTDEDTEPVQGPSLPVTQNSCSANKEDHHGAGLDLLK